MKAIALIAAALLGGHHQLHQQPNGLYEMTTAQQCGPGVVAGVFHQSYRIRCIGGLVTVTNLYFSRRQHVGTETADFRRLTAYNRFGRLAGWVDWRVVDHVDGVKHLAVGVFDPRTGGEGWQFS